MKKSNQQQGTNFYKLSCVVYPACATVNVPFPEKQTNVRLDIFFCALDVTQTRFHQDDASHRQPFINMDNYTFCELGCVVNIVARNRVVIPTVAHRSPGLPEMNPSISHVSQCICAERKHDQLHFGTSLNKSLERLCHETAWTPIQRARGWVKQYSLCPYGISPIFKSCHQRSMKESISYLTALGVKIKGRAKD